MVRNLRDVGAAINDLLRTDRLRSGVFFRSGALDSVESSELPELKTIISLRRTPDPEFPEIERIQVAPNDEMNNYLIMEPVFRDWVERLFESMSNIKRWPLLIHCTAGKDRTGVATALVLKTLGIPDSTIVAEYLLSEGRTYPDSLKSLLEKVPVVEHLRPSCAQTAKLEEVLLM